MAKKKLTDMVKIKEAINTYEVDTQGSAPVYIKAERFVFSADSKAISFFVRSEVIALFFCARHVRKLSPGEIVTVPERQDMEKNFNKQFVR